jgi:asparagine synthase (glutamine-hydrolysing)
MQVGHDRTAIVQAGEHFPHGNTSVPALRDGRSHPPPSHVPSLLDRYRSEGASFVSNLNGLFAGFLVDPANRRAYLFNDRYGSERIYWFAKGGTTYFASEAKALLAILPELRAFDEAGVAQFLTFGSTLHGHTLFRGINVLPGGSLWSFVDGALVASESYFRPDEWASLPALADGVFDAQFQETFQRILPAYLSSGSTVGISLTGGLDTRMIMSCLARSGVRPICYTFGGATGDTLDARLAGRIAKACGLEHRTLRIGADFVADYSEYVDKTVFVTDGCAGALGAHEIYLTNMARQLAPIRLTGNFGSEILRSMSTFKPLGLTEELLEPDFRGALVRCAEEESRWHVNPVTHAAFEEIPWHLFGALAAGRSQVIIRTPYLDNELVQLAYQASTTTRNSPRSALKLIYENNPTLAAIPTDRGLEIGRAHV